MANNVNNHAHPFFAINLSRNFDVDADELRTFMKAMPDWKYVELEGIDTDGTEVDIMFIWTYSVKETPHCVYDIQSFVDFMDMAGFDISPKDVEVVHSYPAFTCECCDFAPILETKDMSFVEGIYSNVANPQFYLQRVMHRRYFG